MDAVVNQQARAKGIALMPLPRTFDRSGLHYEYVDIQVNRAARTPTLAVRAQESVSEDAVEKTYAPGTKRRLRMARDGLLQRSKD